MVDVKDMPYPLLTEFLAALEQEAPLYSGHVRKCAEQRPHLVYPLAERMLGWARPQLGEPWVEPLINGYLAFVTDVNRSQAAYEKRGRYEFANYAEVFKQTYSDPEFMRDYHWGVYVTTFAWEHHVSILEQFRQLFLEPLASGERPGRMLDLGCGSGIWSILSLERLDGWTSTMVDISETSVEFTGRMLASAGLVCRTDLQCRDALEFSDTDPFDAAVSFFLLEHLETPERLLQTLSRNLRPGAPAFVTTALTAAEVDHIYEFRRESEIVRLAEDAGFRVVSTLSATPAGERGTNRFLPRSMALQLVKRRGEFW